MPTPAQIVARRDADYTKRLGALERAAQLGRSTVETADGSTVGVPDAIATAVEVEAAIPGLETQLAETATAVEAATEAADAALEAGLAAGEAGIAAAEEALAAADDAVAQAEAAVVAAEEAQTSAAGKNRTFRSSAPPSSAVDGTADGDLWFQVDTTGATIGLWAWTGAQPWQRRTFDSQVIGNLDAGKITAGTIAVERIAAASLTARELGADAVTARVLAADAVLARNIKAAEITAGKLATDSVVAANIVAGSITSSKIAADAVTAREIKAGSVTAASLSADAIDGKTITGAKVRSAAAGQRVELIDTRLDIYAADDVYVGRLTGTKHPAGGGTISIGTGQGYMFVGANPNGGYVGNTAINTPSALIDDKVWTRDVRSTNGNNLSMVTVPVNDDGHRDQLFPKPSWGDRVWRVDRAWTEQFQMAGGTLTWVPVDGRMPAVEIPAMAAQSIGRSSTVISCPQAEMSGGFVRRVLGAGHGFVAPYAGRYALMLDGVYASAAGGQRELSVRIGTTTYGRASQILADGQGTALPLTAAVTSLVVPAGGVLAFYGYQSRRDNTSASLDFTPNYGSIVYLGPA